MFTRENYNEMKEGMLVKDTTYGIIWRVIGSICGGIHEGVRLKCATSEKGAEIVASSINCMLTFNPVA